MTIVTSTPRPQRPRPKQAIVTARKAGLKVKRPEPEIDPDEEARVREFFARAIRPPSRPE